VTPLSCDPFPFFLFANSRPPTCKAFSEVFPHAQPFFFLGLTMDGRPFRDLFCSYDRLWPRGPVFRLYTGRHPFPFWQLLILYGPQPFLRLDPSFIAVISPLEGITAPPLISVFFFPLFYLPRLPSFGLFSPLFFQCFFPLVDLSLDRVFFLP